MQLSKLGQGLAVSAVSALVVTGLTVAASPALAADGPGVRLLSQADGVASIRRDADAPFGTTVTLTAQQLDPAATISFQVNADPAAGDTSAGWTAVSASFPAGTTYSAGPYSAIDWAPGATLIGTAVALRAVATVDGGPTTYSTRNGVVLSGQDSTTHAVSLGTQDPSSGFFSPPQLSGAFFAQPYADTGHTARLLRVAGTTSATDGSVELSAWNATAGTFGGAVAAAVEPAGLKVTFGPDSERVDGGRFTGVLDITGFDTQSGDALAVRARRDSDSVLPVQLSSQTISTIASVDELVAGPATTPVTLRVADANARPVVGAEVRRSLGGGLLGYTDADGQITVTQPSGTSETYYANTTDADAFEQGVDVVSQQVVTPEYVQVASGTEAVLADGTVFDDREYTEGDVALQVVDELGEPFAGAPQQVTYAIYPTGQRAPSPTEAQTDANGRLVVPFDPEGPDGIYTLEFTGPASAGGEDENAVSFTAGDAVLGLTPTAGTSPSGGQIDYTGTLSVEGKPLPGRTIDLAYTRGTEQAPGTEADAGIVAGAQRVLATEVATGADGTFTVVVGDAVETGGPAETGGRLRVSARVLGDAIDASADFTAAPVPTTTPTTTPTPTPAPPDVRLRLAGSNGIGADRLRITGPAAAAGESVEVWVKRNGRWRSVRSLTLDSTGSVSTRVRDRNGDERTRYRVKLLPSTRVNAFTTKVLRLR